MKRAAVGILTAVLFVVLLFLIGFAATGLHSKVSPQVSPACASDCHCQESGWCCCKARCEPSCRCFDCSCPLPNNDLDPTTVLRLHPFDRFTLTKERTPGDPRLWQVFELDDRVVRLVSQTQDGDVQSFVFEATGTGDMTLELRLGTVLPPHDGELIERIRVLVVEKE